MWREITKFGHKFVERGFVSSHFGNISVRVGDYMYISALEACLTRLPKMMWLGLNIQTILS